MSEEWWGAVPPLVVASLLLLVPGALVIAAGWGLRRITPFLFAPAISVALVGASALLAPLAGMSWSLLPLAALTALASLVAYGIRRRWPDSTPGREPAALAATTLIVVAVAVAVVLTQFILAFGSPENIAQRFDNIVHLNTVRYAIDTADASPFNIGATSDIPFYPSSWHATAAVTAALTGASVPVAVNAANLAIVSVLWVCSSVALSSALFPGRRLAVLAAAAFSTGFGAFPALFFHWGVLYPNALGYSMIPAALAAIVLLMRADGVGARTRHAVLAATLAAGTFLAHPNAFVSLFAFASAYLLGELAVRMATQRTRGAAIRFGGALAATVLAAVALWRVASTNAAVWGWTPWEGPLRALYHGLTVMPLDYGPTIVLLLALAAGFLTLAAGPRSKLPLALPFGAAVVLFTLAAGFPIESQARAWLTDPWYSDPHRLAALLPIAAIPVATLGLIGASDAVRRLTATWWIAGRVRERPRASGWFATAAVGLLLFTVAAGPNVTASLAQVHGAYESRDDALLLSLDEREILQRLTDELPPDALVLGSPRTGASLAYAYAGLEVGEMHIFGFRSEDDRFLAQRFTEIETNPEVCAAVQRLSADYVLDFGDRDIQNDPTHAQAYRGYLNLTPSSHLALVASEGDEARLFEIRGCG